MAAQTSTASRGVTLSIDSRLRGADRMRALVLEADRLIKALWWKMSAPGARPLIIAFMGGTGTGKSTIFNSVIGRTISATGWRRPLTRSAVVYVHEAHAGMINDCPLFDPVAVDSGQDGLPLEVVTHDRADWEHIALVDTPDFDSVEIRNRQVAEALFMVSDALIFVASQEKYGDLSAQDVRERARQWGKQRALIMNKVASDAVFDDFVANMGKDGEGHTQALRIPRMESSPDRIPELGELPEIKRMSALSLSDEERGQVIQREIKALREAARTLVEQLDETLANHMRRISRANERIQAVAQREAQVMESELSMLVSEDVEAHIHERLQVLLRKYDFFFTPRTLVTTTVRRVFGRITGLVSRSAWGDDHKHTEEKQREADLQEARSAARLQPLEAAVARLNREIAEILGSDEALNDLRLVAREDVPRWGPGEVRSRFDETFPGMKELLEHEFERFQEGLSAGDQARLFTAYSAWALLIITAELALGGGFTVFDAAFSAVVLPLIPKWLLDVKTVDLLRQIAARVDSEYRRHLREILTDQAELYEERFRRLLPTDEEMRSLKEVRSSLLSAQ